FDAFLKERAFDLILADYHLPTCTGAEALAIASRLSPGIPFVIVSGIVGEEKAVQALKDGATDFILKPNLARLPAVVRAARERALARANLENAQSTLVRREGYF